jgi:hypothetical protein
VKSIVMGLVLVAAGAAHADDARCAKGIELAKTADLPRAALYLDSCTHDEGIRVRNSVNHRLEATKLSHVTITSLPAGAIGETDALPGETFTTPVTIWAKAGTYRITVGGQTVEKVLEPHSRTTVIINVPPPPKAAKAGVVDFGEEPEKHEGPPPAVEHGTMMPAKYQTPSGPSGMQIDDPFLSRGGDARIAWRLGLRVTGGIADRANAGASGSVGVAALAARPLDAGVMLSARLDYAHRELDTIGMNVGFGYVVLHRRAFALLAGAALRGEVHLQDKLDMMDVSRASIGAAAELDVALLRLPVAFGLRGEQSLSEVVGGARTRALLVEVGYDWR